MRPLALPALLVLLGAAALPATGLLGSATPRSLLVLALGIAAFFLVLVAPWVGRGRPGFARPLGLLIASLPFLALGVIEAAAGGAGHAWPSAAWLAPLAISFVLCGLGGRTAVIVLATFLAVLGGDVLLGHGGAPLLPRDWNPFLSPLARSGTASHDGAARQPGPRDLPGVRRGAPVGVPPGAEGPWEGGGPWLVPAGVAEMGEGLPHVLVLGTRAESPRAEEGAAHFHAGVSPPSHELELDAYDAVVVLSVAWAPGTAEGRTWADALVTYVRRGGVLIGPAPGRDWPAPLGRRLGTRGGASDASEAPARRFGLGRVVRAGSEGEIRALVDALPYGDRIGTVFDRVGRVPPVPAGIARWRDAPAGRRAQGLLLLVFVVVAAALDRILRRPSVRLSALAAACFATCVGLVWMSPGAAGARIQGVSLRLEGSGARHVDALLVMAGPGGWSGEVRWQGDGLVRSVGGRWEAPGRFRVGPGRHGWILRESTAGTVAGEAREDREAAALRHLLVGPIAARRLRFGRSEPLRVSVEGIRLGDTLTLGLDGGAPAR